MEYTKYSLICNVVGAITNIAVNVLLIPIMGSIGAAIATLISYALYAYISSYFIKDMRSMGEIQTRALLLAGLRGERK